MNARALRACMVVALTGCGGAFQAPVSTVPAAIGADARPTEAHLLLDAEFSGRSPDKSVWSTCYPWAKRGAGCTNDPALEKEWYTAANVSVDGGCARLVARRQSAHAGYSYTSGMISTGGTPHEPATFAYLYGYAEARIQLPHGKGMWPAFWMVPANRTWPPEIDAMEWQGVTPKPDFATIHWGTAKHPQSDGTTVHTGVDLADAFHVYAVDWERDVVTWYLDGKAVKTYADRAHIPSQAMYVIVNLAIGGWERGQLNPPARVFPATMKVDYVRVWSRKP